MICLWAYALIPATISAGEPLAVELKFDMDNVQTARNSLSFHI